MLYLIFNKLDSNQYDGLKGSSTPMHSLIWYTLGSLRQRKESFTCVLLDYRKAFDQSCKWVIDPWVNGSDGSLFPDGSMGHGSCLMGHDPPVLYAYSVFGKNTTKLYAICHTLMSKRY